jgi:hypothetical protein
VTDIDELYERMTWGIFRRPADVPVGYGPNDPPPVDEWTELAPDPRDHSDANSRARDLSKNPLFVQRTPEQSLLDRAAAAAQEKYMADRGTRFGGTFVAHFTLEHVDPATVRAIMGDDLATLAKLPKAPGA